MEFIFAKVTNSRLMGSIGLIIAWRNEGFRLDQYFLLDAEGLGISDYIGIKNGDDDFLYREEERLMGGLGSDRLFISKEEAIYLVNHFGNKNIKYGKKLPGTIDEYYFILEKNINSIEFGGIFQKICKTIESPIEFVNYMTMRFIAKDTEALEFFSLNNEIINMYITNINGVLLKNKVAKLDENKYSCECIFEDKDGYYKSKIGFNICIQDGLNKIRALIVRDKKMVNPTWVLKEIKKKEYISIYKVKNITRFIEAFHRENPYCMRSNFEKGVLFTKFNSHNDHVKSEIYEIGNDINSIYYMGKIGQLVVARYSEKNNIEDFLYKRHDGYIELEEEYELEGSLIYEFAQGEYDDFYDFISKI